VRRAALAFLLLPSWAGAASLDAEIRRMSADGLTLESKASGKTAKGLQLSAMIFARGDGGGSRLLIYEVRGKSAKLLHFEPTQARLRFDPLLHKGGRVLDAGDGSLIVGYHVEFPAIRQTSLSLLRYAEGKLQRVGKPLPFAETEDVDLDGRIEIVSHERPLGQFFSLNCESFFTLASEAQRSRIHAFKGGKLETVSRDYPAYYRSHMATLKAEMEANEYLKTRRYGEFLGSALSLFFDYEELGRKQEGWTNFRQTFQLPGYTPASVKTCYNEINSTLRRKLQIPPDWE